MIMWFPLGLITARKKMKDLSGKGPPSGGKTCIHVAILVGCNLEI